MVSAVDVAVAVGVVIGARHRRLCQKVTLQLSGWLCRSSSSGVMLLQTIYRKDYKPTPYLVPDLSLDFQLDEDVSTVKSKLQVAPNYQGSPPPLVLNGRIPLLAFYTFPLSMHIDIVLIF